MKTLAKIFLITGGALVVWSAYIFIKNIGVGDSNNYTPFTALLGLIIIGIGVKALK